jgi:hypothetical protein
MPVTSYAAQQAADAAAAQHMAGAQATANKYILRPSGNANDTNPNGTTYSGNVLGSSTGISAAQLAANQQAIDLADAALGRLPRQLQNAQNQIQHTYDQNNNELQSGFNSAKQKYGQQTDLNGQQFVTNKNQINDQGSQGLLSLLRVLGQHGAGGSSAAMFAAPDAVSQFVAQQRSGAGQTYGQNQQQLDQNWGQYQNGFDNSKKQLADWLDQQNGTAQQQSEKNRVSLLRQLAGLQPTTQDAQPYISKINSALDNIDQLGNFNPSYTGKTPVYNAPDVASYTVDQAGNPVLGNPGNNTGAGSTLAFLLGLKDKNQNGLA